jgi:hypothetical protein
MKKETKASKIMKYIASNPRAKARDVAKALKVSVDSVYQATYLAKKKATPQIKTIAVGTSDKSFAQHARMSAIVFKNPPERARLRIAGMNPWERDNVNHPPHYKVGGIETIDFIEAKSLSYNLGNVVKYITRADHKGNTLEDLKKAQWYLNREVQTMEKSK